MSLHNHKKTDAQIQQDVLNELKWDTRVEPNDVGVEVHGGVVTLTGTVSSWAKKVAAEEAAHRVSGVLDVANDMIIKVPSSVERDDTQIATAVREALKWDVFVPDDKIQSTVTGGFVTLKGQVDTYAQRDDAARAVRNLSGVRNICVVVADAARARVLALDVERPVAGPTTSELVELASLTNPMLRAIDSAVVSDSGSGRRGGARTPLHSTPDHRDHRRRDIERHFAAIVAEEAAAVWRQYPSCELVVVAPPVMLGLLRPAIDRQLRAKDQITIKEVLGDHTKLSTPKLHDLLAESELLPERGRRAPVLPTPGLPA